MENELKKLVNENEQIFYEGRPDKKCFVFESIFNPLLPIAILWGIFDFCILGAAFSQNEEIGNAFLFLIPFFAIHLMPVWIYLGGVLFTVRRYKNTYYIVTDNAIYVSSGIFTKTFNTKPFAELSHVDLHRGLFDQAFGVGDIVVTSNQFNQTNKAAGITLSSIKNYTEVFNIIKKLQKDIYTDVMYPNDKRPSENHGYNTQYKG